MIDTTVPTRRKLLLTLAAVSSAVLLVSCASMLGPREVDVPLAKLQASLEHRFPVDKRLLQLFDLRLAQPQLALLPDERIGLTLDVSVSQAFLRRPLSGSLAISGRLYLDPARQGVYLAEPRLERFGIDGLDESVGRQLSRAANGLLEHALADLPVYSFRMDQLRYAGVQYVPTRLSTTASGLRLSLEPARTSQ